jgi:tetratricopeptide (TPR) repeat protein
MRRAAFLLTLLLLSAGMLSAQIAKNIMVNAGSEEDRALKAITDAADPAQKIALLDKFMADYGKGDMVLAAYEIYIAVYGAQKNYDKAFEIADKTFAVDPDSINTAIAAFRLAAEKNDPDKMFTYGAKADDIVARFKARPAPAGVSPQEWAARQKEALNDVKDNINYIQITLYQLASQQPGGSRKAALLERYATGLPDSPYAANVLILLADDASERGVNLDKAEEYAHRAINLLAKANKPEGLTDEQWAQQKSLQQGVAWSSIGQARLHLKQDAQAVEALKSAAPLLKADNSSYARNQYRLGFAYINLKQLADARAAFSDAASVDSPYKGPAREKLASIPATTPAKQPAKKRP